MVWQAEENWLTMAAQGKIGTSLPKPQTLNSKP